MLTIFHRTSFETLRSATTTTPMHNKPLEKNRRSLAQSHGRHQLVAPPLCYFTRPLDSHFDDDDINRCRLVETPRSYTDSLFYCFHRRTSFPPIIIHEFIKRPPARRHTSNTEGNQDWSLVSTRLNHHRSKKNKPEPRNISAPSSGQTRTNASCCPWIELIGWKYYACTRCDV